MVLPLDQRAHLADRSVYPFALREECRIDAEPRRPRDSFRLRHVTCPTCRKVGGFFDQLCFYVGAAGVFRRRCKYCRYSFFPPQKWPTVDFTMKIERMRMELAGLASPADSNLVSSSANPSPVKSDVWSHAGGSSSAVIPSSSQQTPLDIARDENVARCLQAQFDSQVCNIVGPRSGLAH
ncbi:hypothetical protein K466DRAFT_607974 [Polyporus arcularius HHB13444]|uniref:Uncharacterized protein n=1 Tax=Polyporus arcularius HHB13444 TaxID=1314778 RepID=A0A5C3NIN0_9APHY|nr:hypothetical protein K466DRAFT_607974 [Polyporus arcularius HHB13444]